MDPRYYTVSRTKKQALVDYIRGALEICGCRMIHLPDAGLAPYRFTFEAPSGERHGIMVYAFFANSKVTLNRPGDEHRFQVKYGPDDKQEHAIWQDPYGLYTTLFCGIDPERGTFVGVDPEMHNPTRFFKSIEYKKHHSSQMQADGWHVWERDRRENGQEPVEVLVGGSQASFFRYVRFERESLGEDQGHRALLAEKPELWVPPSNDSPVTTVESPDAAKLHQLAREFEMTEEQVLDLISSARRLKMAVRGWVAEEHLYRQLVQIEGVSSCRRMDEEGGPDLSLVYRGVPLTVECKNVLRQTSAAGLARMDFQRTRVSKNDPCSRYYSADDFDVLAACLHAVEERWTFKYALPRTLDMHGRCPGKLNNNVRLDERWRAEAASVLATAASLKN
jgi:hypothetical protein